MKAARLHDGTVKHLQVVNLQDNAESNEPDLDLYVLSRRRNDAKSWGGECVPTKYMAEMCNLSHKPNSSN